MAILLHRSFPLVVSQVSYDSLGRYIVVEGSLNGRHFNFLSVYIPPLLSGRTFSDLIKLLTTLPRVSRAWAEILMPLFVQIRITWGPECPTSTARSDCRLAGGTWFMRCVARLESRILLLYPHLCCPQFTLLH